MGNASAVCSLCNLLSDPNQQHDITVENPHVVQLLQKKVQVCREIWVPAKPTHHQTCPFQGLNFDATTWKGLGSVFAKIQRDSLESPH